MDNLAFDTVAEFNLVGYFDASCDISSYVVFVFGMTESGTYFC